MQQEETRARRETDDRPGSRAEQLPLHGEPGMSRARSLAEDKQFHDFFTTSVINVPEEMRKVDRIPVEEEPEPPRRRGLGGWLRSLLGGRDAEETAAAPLYGGGPADVQPEEAGEAEDVESIGTIRLDLDEGQEPDRTGPVIVPLERLENRSPARAPQPAPQPAAPAEQEPRPAAPAEKAPQSAVPAEKAPQSAAPAERAPQRKKNEKKRTSQADISQLLEQIDAAQASAHPQEKAGREAPAAEVPEIAAPIAEPEVAEPAAEAPETAAPIAEPEVAEPAAEAPETAAPIAEPAVPEPINEVPEPAAPVGAIHWLTGEASAAAQRKAPAAPPEPENPAEPAPEPEAPTGEVPLQPEEPTGEVPLRPEEATGEVPLQPEEAMNEVPLQPEEPTGEVPLQPEEPTGEVPLQPEEPTGEVPLQPEEPTGEVPLQEEERTGQVPLQPEAPAEPAPEPTAPEQPQPDGRRSRWQQFLQLFRDDEEEDEEPDEETDGETNEEPGEEPDEAESGPAQPDGRRSRWQPLARLFGSEEEPDTPDAPAEDAAAPEPELEYTDPEDAERVRAELAARAARLTLRTALTGILAAALLILDLMGCGTLPAPDVLDPVAAPAAWLGVHLLLLAAVGAVNLPVLKNGLQALLPGSAPTAEALPAVTFAAAAVQAALCLVLSAQFDPAQLTMFGGVAALHLFACVLGQRLALGTVQEGFALMTSGVNNATAYRLKDQRLIDTLCDGMEEADPVVLLSRPASLLQNFLGQSAAPHRSDRQAVEFARVLGAAALLSMVITWIRGGTVLSGTAVLAAVLCMGAPLSAVLVRAVPGMLMQRAAGQVGAVVPGWPGIGQLGDVDVLQVDAADLFPPACAHLYGIKTFQKERIDRAILYATSILIEGCNTLSGLFNKMIEGNTDMLYPVKDLEKRPGQGFVAWCDTCRVLLGTREMMAAEGIALPARDYEDRYTQNGARQLLYLAVSGKLYAMFLFGYTGTKKVARTLGVLRRENIRLLVTADDPTLTAARIEELYRLRPGFVKVLGQPELEKLGPATAYLPATEGCMVHLGGFTSLVGGLQAAAGADSAERSACAVQMVSVGISVMLGLLLSLVLGLANFSLAAVLLYQIAWSALSVGITLTKKY